MSRKLFPVALAMAGLAISSCATVGSSPSAQELATTLEDVRVGDQVDRICFKSGIDSFSEQKRRSLVLRRGVKDEYLVVTDSCPNLDMAMSIRLDRTTGCLLRSDFIRVYQSSFGPTEGDRFSFTRCRINSMYEWNAEAVEAEEDESGA